MRCASPAATPRSWRPSCTTRSSRGCARISSSRKKALPDAQSTRRSTAAALIASPRTWRTRASPAFFPSSREYSRRYGLDARRVALLPDHAIVMHPGPMNRGMEIAAEVADSPRSTIVEQVTNGVSVRMAVLYLLLSGGTDGEVPA